jgi:hypothetical protein
VIEVHKGFCSFGDAKRALAEFGLHPLAGTQAADGDFGDYCFCREARVA